MADAAPAPAKEGFRGGFGGRGRGRGGGRGGRGRGGQRGGRGKVREKETLIQTSFVALFR